MWAILWYCAPEGSYRFNIDRKSSRVLVYSGSSCQSVSSASRATNSIAAAVYMRAAVRKSRRAEIFEEIEETEMAEFTEALNTEERRNGAVSLR